MGGYIATAFFKNGHDRGNALLELSDIYLVQFRHHNVWRISLDDSLEHFVLDDNFAESSEFLISFLDQSGSDFPCSLLSRFNQSFNSIANLCDCVHTRMGRSRNYACIAAFQSDVVVLPCLLVGLSQ